MNDYILAVSIPAFLILIWIEFQISSKRKLPYFNFSSTISNICIGIAERLSNLFAAGIFYSVFVYIYNSFHLFEIEKSLTTFALLLLLADFLWYWYHRSGHEINIFWAAHIVHHQSEEFNFTVSARITIFQSFIRLVFWSALPFIGFPPAMVASVLLIHALYSFFIHTRVIKKMGFLERILVTPSHHRVHHASNEVYLDKNYGSIFIIWDKLFGTFIEEKEEPVYGLTTQLKSHSFLWQHFHYFLELWEAAKAQKGLIRKVKIFLGKPDIVSYEMRQKLEEKLLPPKSKNRPSINSVMKNYILFQLAGAILLLVIFYVTYQELTLMLTVGLSLFMFITLINICAILEQRTWIIYLEYLRIMLVLIAVILFFHNAYIFIATFVFAWLILYHFHSINKLLIRFIYGSAFYNKFLAEKA